ncbi:MAG: VOC family protein [Pseudomonadota bacterium]
MSKLAKRLLLGIGLLALGAGIAVWVLLAASGGESTRPDNAIVRGINYVGVSVSNLEVATELYRTAADLQLTEQTSLNGSPLINALSGQKDTRVSTRLMRSSNAQLRFMQFSEPSAQGKELGPVPVHGPGIAHVCYQVDEKTESYPRFLEGGATPIGEREMVSLNPANPVRYAYAHDLDGIMFEVEHVNVSALDLPEPPANQFRIRHVSLATPNIELAVEFYSVLLQEENPRRAGRLIKLSGDKIDQVSGMPGSEIEMAWFQVRNLELELIQYHSHATEAPDSPRPLDAPGYNMIAFDVADLTAARERLLLAGGQIVHERHTLDDVPTLVGRDLDGNLLVLQSLPASSPLSAQNFKDNGLQTPRNTTK